MKQSNIGKSTIDNVLKLMEKPFLKNLPKETKTYPIITSENPVHKTNKTIEELKEIIVEQGITADKQAKNTKWLTILALFFAFIPIIEPILIEYIPKLTPKNNAVDIFELKNKVLSQSNTILENQVRILKVENELLKSKKTFEKEKKIP
jgi:hypothetical protein